MCRFLIIKTDEPSSLGNILSGFSDMAQKSRALDGDWQGDGWGAAWLTKENCWKSYISTEPVWREKVFFSKIPETRLLLVHARSASFYNHKNNISFNQPFIQNSFAFVFNGLIRKVALPIPVSGKIGSQKIWNLLQGFLHNQQPESALRSTVNTISRYSKEIHALNIGLCDKKDIYVTCHYAAHPDYYQLQFSDNAGMKVVSSEPIDGFDFIPLPTESILRLD